MRLAVYWKQILLPKERKDTRVVRMAYCKICGSTVDELDQVCANCGAPVNASAPSPSAAPETETQVKNAFAPQTDLVVGSWRFVGSILLLGLPVIGLVVAIIWAAGGVSNRNLRNLGRANLLLLLIWTVVLLSALLSVLVKFGSIVYFLNYLVGLMG